MSCSRACDTNGVRRTSLLRDVACDFFGALRLFGVRLAQGDACCSCCTRVASAFRGAGLASGQSWAVETLLQPSGASDGAEFVGRMAWMDSHVWQPTTAYSARLVGKCDCTFFSKPSHQRGQVR